MKVILAGYYISYYMLIQRDKINFLKIANLLLVLFIFTPLIIKAQDIHFSQFKSTPLFINPANTGSSSSDFRFTNDYRSQWRKIDFPYNTLMLAFDSRFLILGRQIGAGLMLVHDQSSSNYLNVDKFYVSLSHAFFYKTNKFVIGLQPGYVLKKYDPDNLTFNSQFDPTTQVFDPGLPNNENYLNDNQQYFDLNVGVLWQARIKNLLPSAGVSVNHVNRPVESFLTDNTASPLPLKYTFHGSIVIPFKDKFAFKPQSLFSYSSGGKEFIAGTMFYYYPQSEYKALRKVYAIGDVRVNPVRNIDAAIFGAGVDVAGFDVCFTYDINVSGLRKVSKFQGAYELSLVFYNNRKRVSNKNEPCFML